MNSPIPHMIPQNCPIRKRERANSGSHGVKWWGWAGAPAVYKMSVPPGSTRRGALYRAMGLLLNRLVNSFQGVGRMGRSLMAVLAVSTPAELRQQIRYLKAENEALRAQLKGPVRVIPAQRARGECLDRFIVRGTRHLDRVGGEG